MVEKPAKKTDKELFTLIEQKIKEKTISLLSMQKKGSNKEIYQILMFFIFQRAKKAMTEKEIK